MNNRRMSFGLSDQERIANLERTVADLLVVVKNIARLPDIKQALEEQAEFEAALREEKKDG